MSLNDFYVILPELVLAVSACLILLLDLWVRSPRRGITYVLTFAVLLCLACWYFARAVSSMEPTLAFGNMVQSDAFGNLMKAFAALATAVTFVYARSYANDRNMVEGGELFSLSLFALLGMTVMISGNHLLILYLGLELLTLTSYALVALRRDHVVSTEAAMKYFVLGAMASGFLLYGMSMIYGATGSLELSQIYQILGQNANAQNQSYTHVLTLGVVFLIAGLAFKFGAAPFHMWVPDVYQGAPTSITTLIGTAPKFAALAITLRLLVDGGLLPMAFYWQQMFVVLAIASLLVGNLAAIAQTNLKRMLAYSTIAQMGFVFLALSAGVVFTREQGVHLSYTAYSHATFYIVAYVLTALASFGIILLLAREGFESEEIADLAGLNKRSPFYAGIMAIALFSLAGIPPLVGFYAKLAILQSLIQTGHALYLGLAVFAVMMSLVGAFYYLRVVKTMYFDEVPEHLQAHTQVRTSLDVRLVLTVNGLLVLLVGIFPAGLLETTMRVIQISFS